jgi:3-methyladenine DNA glycosylase/8-oxoguanine DNA glycosylase
VTTFCLEMRSTADWKDVRYREYTSSAKKADLFKRVPAIRFTDTAHHIIPVVKEHSGRREPRNTMLQDHVVTAIVAINQQQAKLKRATKVHGDVIEALTQALEYFEDREDVVDGSYGEPSPNREMSLAQLCRDALTQVR